MTESGPREVVDDGRPAADEPWHPQSFPGAQSSIAFTPSGKIELAYQDATPVDLVIASWNPATNTRASRRSLRTQGSAGFYPRLALDGTGNAYISSATIKAATAQLAANQLFVDVTRAP